MHGGDLGIWNFHLNQYANILMYTRGQSHDNKFKYVRNIQISLIYHIIYHKNKTSERTRYGLAFQDADIPQTPNKSIFSTFLIELSANVHNTLF